MARSAFGLLMLALAAVPGGVGALKVGEEKPINFTALVNGDAWRRKKVEMKKSLENRKLDLEKKMNDTNDLIVKKEKDLEAKIQQLGEKSTIQFNKRVVDPIAHLYEINYTKKFENNSILNGSVFTRPPTTTPPPICHFPKAGEKIVHFVRVGESEDKLDGMLTSVGEQQAEALSHHLNLSRMISPKKNIRAEVVVMGAARKSMETAILGLKDLMPNATWEIDPDVEGIKHIGEPAPALGTAMLKKLGEDKLLSLYNLQIGVDHGGHEHLWQNAADRWHAWMDRTRARPETRFVAVVPEWVIVMTGLEVPVGEVGIAALVPDPPKGDKYGDRNGQGAWRPLSSPGCWPKPHMKPPRN